MPNDLGSGSRRYRLEQHGNDPERTRDTEHHHYWSRDRWAVVVDS